MNQFLTNKNILLGITGSIAAYKSADLARKLREAGAAVRVVMTDNAKCFITPLTMQAVSGNPVHDTLFDVEAEAAMGHIQLARWADLVLIAPATADFMARLLEGEANDLLTTLCLAAKAPIVVAPAMNQVMWHHPCTQDHIQKLHERAITVLGPAEGSQACGDVGLGRMLEPADILKELTYFFESGVLQGLKVVITAGATQEAIDPIRYISNRSSGKMGYALAQAAIEAGAKVILISGPTHLAPPEKAQVLSVVSACEMYDAVMHAMSDCDIFISVAAVSDFKCEMIAPQKIHKEEASLTLTLKRNPDILKSVSELIPRPFLVGFAAETENVIPNAKNKLIQKKCDMIIANLVGANLGFDTEEHEVTVCFKKGEKHFPKASKYQLARQLVTFIANIYKEKETI